MLCHRRTLPARLVKPAVSLFACLAIAAFAACDSGGDTVLAQTDAGPTPAPRVREELPPAGPLLAGVAEAILPAPVGIGTMGYGAIGREPWPTPFVNKFPGTKRQHGSVNVKAVALSRGPGHEIVLVRADTVGIFQQLRQNVIDKVKERTGKDLTHALIMAGNHTHSGPGRLIAAEGTMTELSDGFFPEFYERIVGAFTDAVVRAIEDLAPAEVGYAMASSSTAHRDRRCENDPLPQVQEDPSLPVIAIRRAGVIDAIVASYGYHGTILGMGDQTLSGDMGSVAEQKISEAFDHPVSVLLFNSWGADMQPADPQVELAPVGAELPNGFQHMEEIGVTLAEAITPVVGGITFEAEPEIRARTHTVRLSRDVMNYDEDTFANFPHGGVLCGLGGNGVCDRVTRLESLDELCIRAAEGELPKQTVLTAGRIGKLDFVTGPAEWSTNLAVGVLAKVRAKSGHDAMFVGYAQDYTGYSLNEDDWWQGGYEATGGLWGPKQGDYLAARAYEVYETFFDGYTTAPFPEPAGLPGYSGLTYTPYQPEAAQQIGTIATDVPENVTASDIVTFTVNGSDPWRGTPVAVLEKQLDGGGGFAPVVRTNGTVVDSTSYDFWVDLGVTPAYAEVPPPAARTFAWTINFPVARKVKSAIPALHGTYRLTVKLPGEAAEITVSSRPFAVP